MLRFAAVGDFDEATRPKAVTSEFGSLESEEAVQPAFPSTTT